jgi:CRP/FNR family transcriptional regulator
MTEDVVAAELQAAYPALQGLDAADLAVMLADAQLVDLPAGTALFGAGSPCRQFPFVLRGSIRVSKVGEGRELQLYRVGPGESCVLTSSCLMGNSDYPASGTVEAVAFHKLDRRVAAALLGHGRTVSLTHQQLADEVGSVREIVTRVLRVFADEGSVRLGRGSIEITDAGALRRIASGA